jgi:CDP-diglyceride synthetase
VVGYLKVLVVCFVVATGLWYLSERGFIQLTEELRMQCWVGIALLGALVMLWYRQTSEHSRAYITDRRFVRFEGSIPMWQSQRALFWNDVVKTRTFAPNFVLRMLKIGTLELIPNFAVEGQNIEVLHAYMYGDLGNYLDKVVFTFRTRPQEMDSLREFVPKPKGERYPGSA